MASPRETQSPARQLAQVLLEMAEREGVIDRVESDLELVNSTLEKHLRLKDLLRNPQIREEGKRRLVDEVFAGAISEVTKVFLHLMLSLGKVGAAQEISREFGKLAEETQERVVAEVTTAVPLDEELSEKLRLQISEMTGKNVKVRHRVDGSVLGGFVVRIDGKVVDASISRQVAALREKLGAGPRKQP